MLPSSAGPKERSRQALFVRMLDLAAIGTTVLCVVYLGMRNPQWEWHEYFEGPTARWFGYGGMGFAAVLLILLSWRSGRVAWLPRSVGFAVALVLQLATVSRLRTPTIIDRFPPPLAQSMANRLDELSSTDRAGWGARVAAHRIAGLQVGAVEARNVLNAPLDIPADWSMPSDVTVAVDQRQPDTLWIWAKTETGEVACQSIPSRRESPLCDVAQAADPALTFTQPHRTPTHENHAPLPPTTTRDGDDEAAWSEYRHDATHSGGGVTASDTSAAWFIQGDGEYRSTASVIDGALFIGAHGTGSVLSLDPATGHVRWQSRLPNWIHQDIVSDGHIGVAGFGDKTGSFWGRAPSGVSAFDVATGTPRWTVFDESSVMTSPVVHDGAIVYGNGAGVIRRRALDDGRLLAQTVLDGGVVMAPPTSVGDTVIFALDDALVCALHLTTLQKFWCTKTYGQQLGHAAPAISDGLVVLTALLPLRDLSFVDLTRQTLRNAALEIWSNIVLPPRVAGQVIFALDLHTGALQWTSRVFGQAHGAEGHTSGTPVFDGETGIVILPVTDSIVAFNRTDGSVRWTAPAHLARGPSTIVNGQVIVAGRDGIIQERSVATGALTCTVKRKVGYDRAGPTLAGGSLIFANLNGLIEAIPLRALRSCDAALLADHTPSAPPSATHTGH